MSNGIYVGASAHVALEKQLETVSNNLANAKTTGFKKDRSLFSSYVHKYEKQGIDKNMDRFSVPKDKEFVTIEQTRTDHSQGSLKNTGSPLDLALSGEGYFRVLDGEEELLQRAGRFTISSDGSIVTADGAQLLDENGDPVVVDPGASVHIAGNGAVFQNDAEIARIGIRKVNDPGWLEKTRGTRYRISDEGEAVQADAEVKQGYLEQSNVNVIDEMVRMIQVQRHYDAAAKAVKSYEEMDSTASNSVGEV